MGSMLSRLRLPLIGKRFLLKPKTSIPFFEKPWLLTLTVEPPKHPIRDSERRYQQETAARTYFPDGQYLIHRDGGMGIVSKSWSRELFADHTQAVASIPFDELVHAVAIEWQLRMKPWMPDDRRKNCVLLGVKATGHMCAPGGTPVSCTIPFATREGKIIVVSY